MLRVLTIIALVLPLAIDTFVLGTALGVAGLARRERLRTSLLLTAFEAGMPVVGFLVGAGLGSFIGQWADYIAAVVLAGTGAWTLWPRGGGEEEEERKVRLLESARGWAVLGLGLSISLDELAIGFGVGLLRLPLILLVTLIAVQAFFAAQLGMRLGSRIVEKAREAAEKLAGGLLVLAAGFVLVEKLLTLYPAPAPQFFCGNLARLCATQKTHAGGSSQRHIETRRRSENPPHQTLTTGLVVLNPIKVNLALLRPCHRFPEPGGSERIQRVDRLGGYAVTFS